MYARGRQDPFRELDAPDPEATVDGTPASGSPVEESSETAFELVGVPRARLERERRETPGGEPAALLCSPKLPYDSSFYRSVARGYLSIRQAIERGNRLYYACRLRVRYGLSPRRALLVTDNRISLFRALRLQVQERKSGADSTQAASSTWSGAWASIAIAAAVFGAVWVATAAWEQAQDAKGQAGTGDPIAAARKPKPAVPSIEVGTSIRRDSQGRPTQVVASAPRAVLEAYCHALPDCANVVRLVPMDEGWNGIHRQGGRLRVISIQLDSTSGLWRTGNGKNPVSATLIQ